jgi:hypothetical protein
MAGTGEETLQRAAAALRTLANRRPRNTLTLERINGQPATSAHVTHVFMQAGFFRDYLSLRLYVP